MTITALGTLSIGAAVPGFAAAIDAGTKGIDAALPDLQDRIASLQAFAPAPFNFAASQALALATLDSIKAGIAGGLPAPSLTAQIDIMGVEIAKLLTELAKAQAQVTILTSLHDTLAAAGISAFAFAGNGNALGGEIGAELAAWTGSAKALVLVTASTATWNAMATVFKVTP